MDLEQTIRGLAAEGWSSAHAEALARERACSQNWRSVAQERERALEELERMYHWLESREREREAAAAESEKALRARIDRLAEELERLRGAKAEARAELSRAAEELGRAYAAVAAVQATLSWRVAQRFRAAFPSDSLRGRALRSGARLARRCVRLVR